MHPNKLLPFLFALPVTVLGFPTEFSPVDPSLLFDRAIGSSCSTPYGAGSCQDTSSCTTQGFNLAGYCPSDPTDVQCCVTQTCSTSSGSGLCMNTDNTCSGKFVAGACPGPSTIQCCTAEKCSTSQGSGVCQLTSSSCSGSYVAGACPGPSNLQCCVANTKCTTPSGSGTCQNTGTTCSGGKYIAGYCPGPTDIECCVKTSTTPPPPTSTKCTTPDGSGVCQNTGTSCSGGHYVAGYCPGPTDIECCVPGAAPTAPAPPPPSGSDLPSVDLSSGQTSAFWTCAAGKGIKKVIPRGYMQSCSVGGEVDSNMVATYTAAKAAGITSIDAYLFPCTGTQPTGVACKSISTQISEFLAAIDDNKIPVNYLWLDIEPEDATQPNVPCNAFQLGAAGNEALAKEWVAAIKATGRKWGIYANAGQWTSMFASIDTDIGSDLPLWAVQDNFVAGVNTVTAFMGGWTKAYAKQYHLATATDLPLCDASVDLDSFTA